MVAVEDAVDAWWREINRRARFILYPVRPPFTRDAVGQTCATLRLTLLRRPRSPMAPAVDTSPVKMATMLGEFLRFLHATASTTTADRDQVTRLFHRVTGHHCLWTTPGQREWCAFCDGMDRRVLIMIHTCAVSPNRAGPDDIASALYDWHDAEASESFKRMMNELRASSLARERAQVEIGVEVSEGRRPTEDRMRKYIASVERLLTLAENDAVTRRHPSFQVVGFRLGHGFRDMPAHLQSQLHRLLADSTFPLAVSGLNASRLQSFRLALPNEDANGSCRLVNISFPMVSSESISKDEGAVLFLNDILQRRSLQDLHLQSVASQDTESRTSMINDVGVTFQASTRFSSLRELHLDFSEPHLALPMLFTTDSQPSPSSLSLAVALEHLSMRVNALVEPNVIINLVKLWSSSLRRIDFQGDNTGLSTQALFGLISVAPHLQVLRIEALNVNDWQCCARLVKELPSSNHLLELQVSSIDVPATSGVESEVLYTLLVSTGRTLRRLSWHPRSSSVKDTDVARLLERCRLLRFLQISNISQSGLQCLIDGYRDGLTSIAALEISCASDPDVEEPYAILFDALRDDNHRFSRVLRELGFLSDTQGSIEFIERSLTPILAVNHRLERLDLSLVASGRANPRVKELEAMMRHRLVTAKPPVKCTLALLSVLARYNVERGIASSILSFGGRSVAFQLITSSVARDNNWTILH